MVSGMPEQSCPQCGKMYPFEEDICPACGYHLEPGAPLAKKNLKIAAILSIFFFGAGQVYNGQIKKGIMFLVGIFVGIIVFLIPGIVIWLFGIYDAIITSRRMNYGKIPPSPTHMGYLALFIFIVLLMYVALGLGAGGYAEIFILRPPGI